ncbi:Hap1p [Kluyveromyces lactis]|uniref:KLLA0F22990p n=1 Tax=Kluyveromyces lactis (strain ATCC 8585 / CBS 2359 / DSM 70799 / NBRC 1267 / NRRL Y-1140 / WM37) TaxID=284590 RepID=Q6CIY4_KLULA|nr:uncharacterized protein KLLA0_F22990g [Kluyveromyces lactis]CAG98813.1 KLLA0F22990p [Kluyveromyces lactis]|eukprot:XP_456105.1 uncharacterized protein KLLA0_F22990g [Kluyveromyces lactis]
MSSITSPGTGTPQQKRKRNRVPLSCTICRKRKVKCDKGRPQCQQCVKTGVGHLCHYMEQTWAEEAEKELSKDSELKQLRERVKSLEETLSKVHATTTNPMTSANQSPASDGLNVGCPHAGGSTQRLLSGSNGNSPILSTEQTPSNENKYDNDELDLTRQFDMLHLKNNGTVHLGATHWLAIMKGDPYLKLLWGHIFTLREKLTEWYSQKRKSSTVSAGAGTCPVIHGSIQQSKCPVAHATRNVAERPKSSESRCPVAHAPRPEKNSTQKCPVDHSAFIGSASSGQCPVAHTVVKEEVDATTSGCPIDHTKFSSMEGSPDPAAKGKLPALPSFQNLTAKCPMLREGTPTPTLNSQESGHNSKRTSVVPEMSSEQATDAISKALPPKKIVFLFMDKFFNHIYPIVPILDEQTFKLQVNQILQTNNNQTTVKLTKPLDACVLGILLIILRITWLSLTPNACNIKLGPECESLKLEPTYSATITQAKEEAMLLKYETPIETVEIVRKFLIKFDEISSFANSNVNITTVQFAIFYKLYLMSSPDKTDYTQPNTFTSTGQDNETHQVLMSSIVQMAFSCGLHRDPDNFPQLNTAVNGSKLTKEALSNTERLKHTWRKTWFFIVSLDVQQSLSLGTPRLLRNLNDFSDTKLPCASKIDYVNNIKELILVKNFKLFFQIDLCIISVLNHILNVSLARTVRKFELDQLIQSLGKLRDGVTPTNDVVNDLVNKGLLFTTEGTVLLDQNPEHSYSLPSLTSVLSTVDKSSSEEKEKKLSLAHESTTRALFFSKHVTISMLQYLLNYILFTHYEPLGNEDPGTRILAKDYAQEALNYAVEGFKNCILFYNSTGMNNMFSYMDVLLSPTCLDVGHRALQFIVCLILRAKCGPLTGMGESPAIGNQNNTVTSSSEDETDQMKRDSSPSPGNVLTDVSLDAGENLAEVLLARMILFHKLTKQISAKYNYAVRMTKSTGFFITLLKKPSSKSKTNSKNKNLPRLHQHPNIANMTSFFKNVPSLVLSAGGDQIRRCPVYQDAVGFLPSKVTSGTFNSIFHSTAPPSFNSAVTQQLPPLNIQYQPITFRDTLRRTSDVRGTPETAKRRKVDTTSKNFSEQKVEVKVENPQISLPPSPAQISAVTPFEPLLPTLDKVPAVPQGKVPYSPTPSLSGTQPPIVAPSNLQQLNFNSPVPPSDLSNITDSPDFEDFLSEHTSLNGLMINPSSIVEAVGFDGYSGNGGLRLQADFLPIDNNDGLNEMAPITEFSMWE